MGISERIAAALAPDYEVGREVGHGGMARVYLARDLRHARQVAIKVLHPELAAVLGAERFHHEIRIAAGLVHPNIVPLLDSGEAGGFLYYVMPYVPGETLRARIQRERQLPLADAVTVVAQAATALEYAHRQGVIHRDIKPENILLLEGQAVVADFGVARAIGTAAGDRITSSGFVVGTPAYMSPEQAAADPSVDGRSDEYSLGCVAYEMLAGQPPFIGPTAQAISALRLTTTPPPVRAMREGVPEAVDRAIARALRRVPADRHGGPGAFAAALATAAGGPSGPGPTADAGSVTAGKYPRARWLVLLALGLAAAATALGLRRKAPPPAAAGDPSVLAVVPFTPASPDTALERLGRDLAVTVSHTLDGVGGMRVVDAQTVIGRWVAEGGIRGSRTAQALGAGLGAGSVLHGSLVRVGPEVQLDLALVTGEGSPSRAHVTLSAPPDSIGFLTDSIARAVIARRFRRGAPPSPSLDAALRTRSLPALRDFLEGEQALARNDFDGAAVAYQRAVESDSTFWLAWSRLALSLEWNLKDSGPAWGVAGAHLADLPARDRLMVSSTFLARTDRRAALDSAAEMTRRFPDSWMAWLALGDGLVHLGPPLGHGMEEAQDALARSLALNPDLVPAWEHYAWAASVRRDADGLARAVNALTRLEAGPQLGAVYGSDQLLQFRLELALLRGDSAGRDSLWPAVVRDLAAARTPVFAASFLVRHGWPREQGRLSVEALARGVPVGAELFHHEAMLHALAVRGAWDSVLAVLSGGRSGLPREVAGSLRYPLAAVGGWLGLVTPEGAERHRAASVAVADREAAAARRFGDGLRALARGNVAGAEAEARGLEGSDDPHARLLRRSLTLLARIARGDAAAGAELAALEEDRASGLGASVDGENHHPLLGVVNRLAAARALTREGDPRRARALLTVVEGRYSLSEVVRLTLVAQPLFEFERGRAAESMGEPAEARRHYAEFLRLCDLCPAGVSELVSEARRKAGGEG